MVHDDPKDTAWLDHRNIFGAPMQLIGDSLLMSTSGITEIGGGKSQYENFGSHQSLSFKDAEVSGSPIAYYIESMGGHVLDGNAHLHVPRYDYDGNIIPKRVYTEQEIQRSLNNLMDRAVKNLPIKIDAALYQKVGGLVYRPMVKINPHTLKHKYKVQAMVRMFAATLRNAKVDYYACNSNAEPFKPFFSSRLDGITWREGYPINDPEFSTTILNPASNDGIVPSNQAGSILKDFGKAGWGHIYPRSGFINAIDDYKAAAVIGVRAIDLVNKGGKTHIAQKMNSPSKEIYWQPLYPKASASCYKNMADSVSQNNVEGNYAWNGWRRYSCSLSQKGTVIATIRLGNVACIGSDAK